MIILSPSAPLSKGMERMWKQLAWRACLPHGPIAPHPDPLRRLQEHARTRAPTKWVRCNSPGPFATPAARALRCTLLVASPRQRAAVAARPPGRRARRPPPR
eukprot:28749-Chlamydomonas_euryale.AAC.1